MVYIFKKYLSSNYLPRWIVASYDLAMVALSLSLGHLLYNRLHPELIDSEAYLWQMGISLPVYFLGFAIFKPFTQVVRHTTMESTLKIFFAVTFSAVFLVVLRFFVPASSPLFIPLTIIILQYLVTLILMFLSRLAIKAVYNRYFRKRFFERNIMIFGAGSVGQML